MNNEYKHSDSYCCQGCGRTYTERQVYHMVILHDDLRSFVVVAYPHDKDGNVIGCKWAVCCLRDSSNNKLRNTDPVVYGTRSIDSLIDELKLKKFTATSELVDKGK
jgi:hypothetical protein